jgi:hypothetical protein
MENLLTSPGAARSTVAVTRLMFSVAVGGFQQLLQGAVGFGAGRFRARGKIIAR